MRLAQLYQRPWLWVYLPLALLATAAIGLLWAWVFPIPSQHLRISTGAPEGIYFANAQLYAQKFAEHGITLQVLPSAGSVENMARISDLASGVDLALVQGGFGSLTSSPIGSSSAVQTLANIDIEPVWIFTRMQELDSLSQLQGLRVSIGPVGSGSRKVALKLLESANLGEKDLQLVDTFGMGAVRALVDNKLDVAMFVSAPGAPAVNAMLATPGIGLVHLRHAAALTERIPYLESRMLAQGMLDPNGKFPRQDIGMLVTTASLVARESLSPALKRLATQVATEVHQRGGAFYKAGDFPNLGQADFPVAPEARQTLLHGLPWLEQRLGFWSVQALWRVLLLVLPIVLLGIALARLLPAYASWLMESRVNRWYGELKYIEHDLAQESPSGLDLSKYHSRLKTMEFDVHSFPTPPELMQRLYILQQHIEFVRLKVLRMRGR